MTIIYDTKDNELPIATFDTQRGAANFLGVTLQAIKMAQMRDTLISRRYKVIFFANYLLEEKDGKRKRKVCEGRTNQVVG